MKEERQGEKMTLRDYEKAIHDLLMQAAASGLEPSDLIDCGVAVIENTFLDDPSAQ